MRPNSTSITTYAIVLILSILPFVTYAQTVTFNETPTVSRLMDQYLENNMEEETLRGWRIQIISTDDRRKMEATKAKFENLYPEIEVSWKHMVPYYQVRAGAYENKTKLMAFLITLKEEFPMATPVVDQIDKREFVK